MEPLSLYGNNARRMRYLKYGHLPLDERRQRMDSLYKRAVSLIDNLDFKMKRYEIDTYGYDTSKWPFYPNTWKIGCHIIYYIGIVDHNLISIDDILCLCNMEPAPYDVLFEMQSR